MVTFEFDEAKSQNNLLKHGIDFADTQALWSDPGLLEIPAKTEDAPRYLDREAGKLGVTRQSIIKISLAEHLEMLGSNPSFKRN